MINRKTLNKRTIVTGGGSGGHISVASSIISKLQEKYLLTKDNFLYIGGDLGVESEKPGESLEKKVFSKEVFRQEYIRAGKLQRTVSLRSIFLALRTLLGFIDSYKIIRKFKPEIVISTGGFVSVPVCLIAKLFKAKIYLHEQTATVGLANSIVANVAEKIFVAFPSSISQFPPEKTIHTGNLVRPEIFQSSSNTELVKSLKKMIENNHKLPLVYISGGSLGSHIINQTVEETLPCLLQDFQIILQTGENKILKDYELLLKEKKKLNENLQDRILITKYIEKEEIGFVLNNIDLFVGRSGANTVYEMGILEIPSILIPIPWVTNNEQEKNALVLQNLGLGRILPEGELTPEKLIWEIKKFYKQKKLYNREELSKIFLKNAERKVLENIGL